MKPADYLAELASDGAWIEDVPTEDVPELLGALESLKARLWRHGVLPASQEHEEDAGGVERDRLLTVEEVADIMGKKKKFVYNKADSWPFTRRPSERTLRFSERGLYEWLDRT